MRVELIAFSGRENPWWNLTDIEADELARRLTAFPAGPTPPEPAGLGYSGFLITNPSHDAAAPEVVTVYRGILVDSSGTRDSRTDTNGLEDWLLRLARSHGYGDLLSQLGQ